jgi:hypothetical protein
MMTRAAPIITTAVNGFLKLAAIQINGVIRARFQTRI